MNLVVNMMPLLLARHLLYPSSLPGIGCGQCDCGACSARRLLIQRAVIGTCNDCQIALPDLMQVDSPDYGHGAGWAYIAGVVQPLTPLSNGLLSAATIETLPSTTAAESRAETSVRLPFGEPLHPPYDTRRVSTQGSLRRAPAPQQDSRLSQQQACGPPYAFTLAAHSSGADITEVGSRLQPLASARFWLALPVSSHLD